MDKLKNDVLYTVYKKCFRDWMVQLAIRGWNFEINLRWVIAVSMFSSLFGISDEYHQSFVTGRHASIADASIDSISATVTSSLMWIAGRFTSSS